ncbi:MAG: hypothetical protein AAFN27_00460 [Pseudomonadota bacterium]
MLGQREPAADDAWHRIDANRGSDAVLVEAKAVLRVDISDG